MCLGCLIARSVRMKPYAYQNQSTSEWHRSAIACQRMPEPAMPNLDIGFLPPEAFQNYPASFPRRPGPKRGRCRVSQPRSDIVVQNQCPPNLSPQIEEPQQRFPDRIENDPTDKGCRDRPKIADHATLLESNFGILRTEHGLKDHYTGDLFLRMRFMKHSRSARFRQTNNRVAASEPSSSISVRNFTISHSSVSSFTADVSRNA
jgi:hypothetical protein